MPTTASAKHRTGWNETTFYYQTEKTAHGDGHHHTRCVLLQACARTVQVSIGKQPQATLMKTEILSKLPWPLLYPTTCFEKSQGPVMGVSLNLRRMFVRCSLALIGCVILGCDGGNVVGSPSSPNVTADILAACQTHAVLGSPAAPEAQIIIDASSDRGPLRSLQGFLNGINTAPGSAEAFNAERVQALKPRFWRVGTGAGVVIEKVRAFGPRLTLVVADAYTDTFPAQRPWENWAQYEAWLQSLYAGLQQAGANIAYWDVWGEPQGGTPFRGTYAQLLELYSRTHDVLKQLDPNANIIGPSYDNFEGTFGGKNAEQLLTDINAQYGIKLEALSWHEQGNQAPEKIPEHVAVLKQFLAAQFPGYLPELHVNEYSGPNDHLLPGWSVGWLYYLTEAGVDVATRACWPVTEASGRRWSDCWAGLNGLLGEDNSTPQPTYWVHRFYADMAEQTWLSSQTDDPRAVALAVKSAAGGEVTLLAGRLSAAPSGPAKPVRFIVRGLPWAAARVKINLVPQGQAPAPLPAPINGGTCAQPLAQGELSLTVSSFDDGTAIWLQLSQAP